MMTAKLDYLKKYLSKSDAKQLQSQVGKGENIKIKNTAKLKKKRRKHPTQQTGLYLGDVELDEKKEESSDWSDGEGPTVVAFRDESKERLNKMWNPICPNKNNESVSRHDSCSDEDKVVMRRHDSDSDGHVKREGTPHSDSYLDVIRRVRHDSTHSKDLNESDSDLEVRRKPSDREQRRGRKGSRWSRDERDIRTKDTAFALVVESKQLDNQTVYRDKDGHKIDIEREAAVKAEQERAKLERDAKFQIMKSGVAQAKMREERAANFAQESGKGLARYKGDKSLNEHLKAKELMDDPLIQMKSKKSKRKERNTRCKPTYQGNFPSNRFDIRPGYRWDGVDRSNGYEKQRFQITNSSKADHDEYYKWSTEDL